MRKSVEKLRNGGTWSEAKYWGAIRSMLRRGFRYWKPLSDTKNKARRAFLGGGRQKWEYQCKHCQRWFKGNEVEVDHIVPCGSLKCAEDLAPFVERLTTESGFQLLCKPCHLIKTKEEKAARENDK